MAGYTKREQRAAEMRERLARDTDARYTIFSNDFDPALRTPDLTLGQAIMLAEPFDGMRCDSSAMQLSWPSLGPRNIDKCIIRL